LSAKKRDSFAALSAGVLRQIKQSLKTEMKRILFGGCLLVFFGCGARTEYFNDLDDAGGDFGVAGASPNAGAPNAGGVPGVAGAPSFGGAPHFGGYTGSAGFPNVAGAPHFAGSSGTGGRAGGAGAPGKGGAPGVAGAPGKGGAPGVAGAPGKGGAPNVGGTGATAGIVEACQVIAGNSCQQCLCSTCSSQIVECFSNFGCALILACAQQTGCQGVACYTAQTCRPVIDQFGGLTGSSMKDVLSLLSCSLSSQNSCSCN